MKLVRCYIENFGTLCKFSYQFHSQLNMIEQENAWGKTTFAAFIKAMFYGLEDKRGNAITDRKQYEPWNGGRFGGNVIFEIEGKQYKIERFFGKREKDDSFSLFRLDTNTISEEYSQMIGEEIWKVDRDSYDKTAFISLQESGLLNDIIASKLGNLDQADLENSGKVIAYLDKELVKRKAKRGSSGVIDTKKEEYNQLKQNLRECDVILQNVVHIEKQLENERDSMNAFKKQIEEYEACLSHLLVIEKSKQYHSLVCAYEEQKNKLQDLELFFAKHEFTVEDEAALDQYIQTVEIQKDSIMKNTLTKEEEADFEELHARFKSKPPKDYELDECASNITLYSNSITKMNSLRVSDNDQVELERLQNKYRAVEGVESIESIDSKLDVYFEEYNIVLKEKMSLEQLNESLEQLKYEEERTEKERTEQKSPVLLVLAGLLFILGVILAFKTVLGGALLALLGIVIGCIAILAKRNTKSVVDNTKMMDLQDKIKSTQNRIEQNEMNYQSFLKSIGLENENIAKALSNCKMEVRDYRRLKETVERFAHERKEQLLLKEKLQNDIEDFLGKYFQLTLIVSPEMALAQLRKEAKRYQDYESRHCLRKEAQNCLLENELSIKELLGFFFDVLPKDYREAFRKIQNQKMLYLVAVEEMNRMSVMKIKFEQENSDISFETIQSNEDTLDEKTLLEKKKVALEAYETATKRYNDLSKDLHEYSMKADQKEDYEAAMSCIQEQIEELTKEYRLLQLTIQCMRDAKENLAKRYMADMTNAFRKYLGTLTIQNGHDYQIDIGLNVLTELDGQMHKSSELSKGMKDLIQICMRMALVEAVYKEVSAPILIFDDPFVNLDDEKLEGAVDLVRRMAKDYQILYYTCHSSRAVQES